MTAVPYNVAQVLEAGVPHVGAWPEASQPIRRRHHCLLIAVQPDDREVAVCVEETLRVSSSSDSCVHDHPLGYWSKELDDFG
jgi:hypothetical protein